MRHFVFAIFLTLPLLGQDTLLTDTFDSFVVDTTAGSSWIFDPINYGSAETDHGPNGLNLTFSGIAGDTTLSAVSLVDTNANGMTTSRGDVVWTHADNTALDVGSVDFQVVGVFKTGADIATVLEWAVKYAATPGGYSWYFNNQFEQLFRADGVNFNPKEAATANTNYIVIIRLDRDGMQSVYYNGVYTDSISISSKSAIDVNNTTALSLAKHNGTYYQIVIKKGADVDTHKEMREAGFLAAGWTSYNGFPKRQSFGFHQGFAADTVARYIGGTGRVQVSFTAWAASGTPNVNIYTDSNSGASVATSTSKAIVTRTIAGGDTLKIGSSGTVYIDNLTVTQLAGNKQGPGFPGFPRHPRFPSN